MSSRGNPVKADLAPEWMSRKERGNMFWLRVMTILSLRLGRGMSRIIVYGIAFYFLLAVPSARIASRTFLNRCLVRPATWFDLYRHFLTFSSTIHDRVYLINDRHELFDFNLFGTESLDAIHESKDGLFLFGAHMGSFEVMRSLARDNPKIKVSIAMYPENARQINQALSAINPKAMQDIIPLGKVDSILAIHEKLEQGTMIGILADRAAGPDQYVTIPFLGEPARFPTGPFRMAAMLRKPVYFMTGIYRGGNRYDTHFELLADFSEGYAGGRDAAVREVLIKYANMLERYCRLAPFNWFNFYDFWESASLDNS